MLSVAHSQPIRPSVGCLTNQPMTKLTEQEIEKKACLIQKHLQQISYSDAQKVLEKAKELTGEIFVSNLPPNYFEKYLPEN